MRLLYAMSRRDRDQQLCPHEPDVKACSEERVAVRRVAGEDEEDRGLHPLRKLDEEMSVRAEYAGASGEKLRGL